MAASNHRLYRWLDVPVAGKHVFRVIHSLRLDEAIEIRAVRCSDALDPLILGLEIDVVATCRERS